MDRNKRKRRAKRQTDAARSTPSAFPGDEDHKGFYSYAEGKLVMARLPTDNYSFCFGRETDEDKVKHLKRIRTYGKAEREERHRAWREAETLFLAQPGLSPQACQRAVRSWQRRLDGDASRDSAARDTLELGEHRDIRAALQKLRYLPPAEEGAPPTTEAEAADALLALYVFTDKTWRPKWRQQDALTRTEQTGGTRAHLLPNDKAIAMYRKNDTTAERAVMVTVAARMPRGTRARMAAGAQRIRKPNKRYIDQNTEPQRPPTKTRKSKSQSKSKKSTRAPSKRARKVRGVSAAPVTDTTYAVRDAQGYWRASRATTRIPPGTRVRRRVAAGGYRDGTVQPDRETVVFGDAQEAETKPLEDTDQIVHQLYIPHHLCKAGSPAYGTMGRAQDMDPDAIIDPMEIRLYAGWSQFEDARYLDPAYLRSPDLDRAAWRSLDTYRSMLPPYECRPQIDAGAQAAFATEFTTGNLVRLLPPAQVRDASSAAAGAYRGLFRWRAPEPWEGQAHHRPKALR